MAIAITEPTVEVASTSNTNTYAMGAFTPTANSLLVCFVFASATVAVATMSGGGLLWSRVLSQAYNAGGDTGYVFIAQVGGSPASTTPTFNCTGDNATGCLMSVLQVTGHNQLDPIYQAGSTSGSSTNPTIARSAANTNNGYLAGFGINRTAPAALPPTLWTEACDTGYSSPTAGGTTAFKAGGETSTSVTFTALTGAWGLLYIEICEASVGSNKTGTGTHALSSLGFSASGIVTFTGTGTVDLKPLDLGNPPIPALVYSPVDSLTSLNEGGSNQNSGTEFTIRRDCEVTGIRFASFQDTPVAQTYVCQLWNQTTQLSLASVSGVAVNANGIYTANFSSPVNLLLADADTYAVTIYATGDGIPYTHQTNGTPGVPLTDGAITWTSFAKWSTIDEPPGATASNERYPVEPIITGMGSTGTVTAPAGTTGTATLALSSLDNAGVGANTPPSHTGTATHALSPLALAGAANETFTGTGTHALSPLANALTGTETFSGVSSIALSPLVPAGTGTETFSGASSVALSSLATAGTGTATSAPVTGTGTLSLSPLAFALTGSEKFIGVVAHALSPLSPAATGLESFIGTAALALSSLSFSATSVLSFLGTGAVAISPLALTAVASETFLGTGSLLVSSLSFAGSGAELFTGSGSIGLSSLSFAGVGEEQFTGAVTFDLSPLNFAATSDVLLPVTGTGALALSSLVFTGTGSESFSGACALALSSLAPTLTGSETFTGTGASQLASLAFAGTAEERYTGTGSLSISSLQMSGAGAELFTGTNSVALQSLGYAGSSQLQFLGTSSFAFSPLGLAASGTNTPPAVTGLAAFALSPLDVAAAGGFGTFTTGVVFLALSPLMSAGAGSELFSGAATLAVSSPQFSGMGAYEGLSVTGTASLALSSPSFGGTGLELFVGAASVALPSLGLSSSGGLSFTGTATFDLSALALSSAGALSFLGVLVLPLSPLRPAGEGTVPVPPVTGEISLALAPLSLYLAGFATLTPTLNVVIRPVVRAIPPAPSWNIRAVAPANLRGLTSGVVITYSRSGPKITIIRTRRR